MILDADTNTNYNVYDITGNKIFFVKKYDTETRLITIVLPVTVTPNGEGSVIMEQDDTQYKPKEISFVLEGSWAEDELGNKV